MTCSRMFVLGALLTLGPTAAAQSAPPAKKAAAPAAAAKPAAKAAVKAPPAPAGKTAPAPAGKVAPAPAGKMAPAPAGKMAPAPAGKIAPAAQAVPTATAKPAASATPVVVPYPAGLVEPRVRSLRNQVTLSGPPSHPAKVDDVVSPGQVLSTQAQSAAELGFADGTRAQLGENSDLSLYGVAPPLPAPQKGKPAKPAPFRPGTTTLLRGELTLTTPAPPPPPPVTAPLAKGAKPVKVAKVVKPPAAKTPVTASVATPVGKVTAAPNSTLRVSVEPTGQTRLAVYGGTATLQAPGKAKPLAVPAGSGTRIESAKAAAKPVQALPAAPTISGVQQLSFSTGEPVAVAGSFGPAAGAAAPAGWRMQVARDAKFDKVLTDARLPGSDSKLLPQPVAAGDYYIRLSALSAEGLEGQTSAPVRVRVARVTVVPGSEGRRASVSVDGKDLFCSLDGGPMAAVSDPLPLSPARDHTLQCATVAQNARPEESAQLQIAATQSGPLVARVEPGAVTFSPTEGQRQVTLVLSDAAGTPVTGATVAAQGIGGLQVGELRETATPGSYLATVKWPVGQTGHSVRYRVNDVESYEARLPDAQPAAPVEPVKTEEDTQASKTPKRVAFELAAMPVAAIDAQRLVFGVGGALDVGIRVRLAYGALAVALRPQYEFYQAAPSVSHVVGGGLPITFRIRQDVDADLVPYIGVVPQIMADYSFLTQDGVRRGDGEWRVGFGLGGLAGTEFRFKYGAVFVEGGYRHMLLRSAPESLPSLSSIFANVGLRLTF